MNSEYRRKVDKAILKINKHELDKMREYLISQEYDKCLMEQEINSRLIEKSSLKKVFVGVNIRISSKQRQELRQLLQDSLIK
jgi:hypothetical protein